MFERLGPGARQALEQAEAQARLLRSARVGPEHLVLGLLTAEGDDVTAGWLRGQLGAVSMAPAEAPLVAGGLDDRRFLPYDPAVHGVLRRALLISAEMRARNVEPGHLLLALLEVAPPAAVTALAGLGVDIDALREETRTLLAQTSRASLLPETGAAAALVEVVSAAPEPAAALAAAVRAGTASGIATGEGTGGAGGSPGGRAGAGVHGPATSRRGRFRRAGRRPTGRPVAVLAAVVLVALAVGAPGRFVGILQPTGAGHVAEPLLAPNDGGHHFGRTPAGTRPQAATPVMSTPTAPGDIGGATTQAAAQPSASPSPLPVVSFALAHTVAGARRAAPTHPASAPAGTAAPAVGRAAPPPSTTPPAPPRPPSPQVQPPARGHHGDDDDDRDGEEHGRHHGEHNGGHDDHHDGDHGDGHGDHHDGDHGDDD